MQSKLYCSSHPYETVTNFCSDPQCLVGLCATCICEHTQQHMRRGVPPSYENIKNTYSRYGERMREQVERIQLDQVWLGAICAKIEDNRRAARGVLTRAREDCLALVQKHFDELEAKIENEIVSEAKRQSLHSEHRLDTLSSLLAKEVSSLLLYSKDLDSSKFLETVQRLQQEVFPNSTDFHLRVSKEIKENQIYTANVIYKDTLLSDIEFALKRLVNLEFLLPRVECVEERVPDRSRGNSMAKKGTTSLLLSTPVRQDPMRVRNVSAVVSPYKQSLINSVPIPAPPIKQILSPCSLRMQTENISKASRLTSGLKIIRQTRRQSTMNEQARSITSSCVSYDKENDLAHSTYCDTGSNFFNSR